MADKEIREKRTQSANQSQEKNLSALFAKLVPLVDSMAGKLGLLLLVSLLVLVWIFVYLVYFYKASLVWSILISGLTALPMLIILRFWMAFKSLKDMPNIAREIAEDVSDDVVNTWKAVNADKKGAFNLVGQIRNLFEVKSLISSAGDIFEQYFNISILLNPFSLILGVVSLIGLAVVFITGLTLAIISLL